jgi:DnaJ-class molecular chaperone
MRGCADTQSRTRFGRQQQQRPPRTVEVPLKLTLKELYTGTTKKLKVTRKVFNKESNKLEEKEVSPSQCCNSFACF